MGGGSTKIRCSPMVRNSPLKSRCFSSENHDHCQMPGRSCLIVLSVMSVSSVWSVLPLDPLSLVLRLTNKPTQQTQHFYNVPTASFTIFVTFVTMLCSFGKSMMSSSGTVMNLRLGPF